jgi:uncharacterized OB-fold protein
MTAQIPLVEYLVLGDEPHLRAHSCTACGALFFDRRNACARCSGQEFIWKDLATTGKIRAYTVIQRGAKTPFTSVVVDLDGGGSVKANLLNTIDPAEVAANLDVELDTFLIGTDDDGTEAIGFGFKQREAAA